MPLSAAEAVQQPVTATPPVEQILLFRVVKEISLVLATIRLSLAADLIQPREIIQLFAAEEILLPRGIKQPKIMRPYAVDVPIRLTDCIQLLAEEHITLPPAVTQLWRVVVTSSAPLQIEPLVITRRLPEGSETQQVSTLLPASMLLFPVEHATQPAAF